MMIIKWKKNLIKNNLSNFIPLKLNRVFNNKFGKTFSEKEINKINKNSKENNLFMENSSNSQQIIEKNVNSSEDKEEFIPNVENETYRELYKDFSFFVIEDNMKELDDIPHNKLIDGREYKYGLTSKNELIFTDLIPKLEEDIIPNTMTENLFELLELDKESSYESLLIKFQNNFNHGKIYI